MRKWIYSGAVCVWLVLAQLCAHAADPYEEGVKYYNAGRYQESMYFLSQAVGATPQSPMVHYYLANALCKLRMHEQAIQEFETCYRLDPYGAAAGYAKLALRAYRRPVPAVPTATAATSRPAVPVATAGGARMRTFATAGGFEESNHHDRAMSVIRRQAEHEKSKHEVYSKGLADNCIRQAESDARRITEEAAAEKDRVYNPPPIVGPRGGMMLPPPPSPEVAKMRIEEIERTAKELAQRAKLLAEARAKGYQQHAKERQAVLDEVVSNLESQLEAPDRPGSAHLQPVGTDLYVRFYGYGNGAISPPSEVHPAAVHVVGRKARQGELSSAEPKEPDGRRVSKRVRGRLLGGPLTPVESEGYDPR